MKRVISLILAATLFLSLVACGNRVQSADIAATTLPVYELTARLCESTGLKISRIITENVSCLHDYTLQPGQMKSLETAALTVISGAGLEDFLEDTLLQNVADASIGIDLLCAHHDHDHEHDSHIWLDPANGLKMAENIYAALCKNYPEKEDIFTDNFKILKGDFGQLIAYGREQLSTLSCRKLVTFHDGFAYMANAYDLTILHAMEEESGSEASAKELIEICRSMKKHKVPAVFTEVNGSDRAATIVAKETGAKVYTLDTAMTDGYFNALYRNIDTLKEALG